MNQSSGQPKNVRGADTSIRKEVRERTAGYIIAALGFVAGLAWNEAVKSFIDHFFPLSQNSLFAKFAYAVLVTVVVVVLTTSLMKFLGDKEE